MAEAIP